MSRLDNYEPVEQRLSRFWGDHENGRVVTDLVHRDEKQYIIRAEVYTDREDTRPAASGYAEEIIGSSVVNKTNALENAETSAIGRALANLNYAPIGARPSREEMEKSQRGNGLDPAKWVAAVVDALLLVSTEERAEAGLAKVEESEHGSMNVSGLLKTGDLETLGIDHGAAVTLSELAVYVAGYVAKHGRAVRVPAEAVPAP